MADYSCPNLELCALRWLRWQKKCEYALCQRSPRSWTTGIPDVLGVTKSRYLIEIEIKRSVSDFRADGRKTHRLNRELLLDKQPRQFYYLMPPRLATKLATEIPDWAGLMTADHYSAMVIKDAPLSRESKRLTVKECLRMVKLLSNHLIAAEESKWNVISRNMVEHDPYYWSYEI